MIKKAKQFIDDVCPVHGISLQRISSCRKSVCIRSGCGYKESEKKYIEWLRLIGAWLRLRGETLHLKSGDTFYCTN